MTDSLKKTFRDLATPYFKDVFILIDNIFRDMQIDYYLIGAQARDIHFLKNGYKPGRQTRDIDFAVMVPEMAAYNEMMRRLLEKDFIKEGEPYRIKHKTSDTVIDFLPFGDIEEAGTVNFPERKIEISVLGMKEVQTHTVETLIEDISIMLPPLSGLVILKFISYCEKPYERTKDLDDFKDILQKYFDINSERFFEDHLDLVDEIQDNFDELGGARLLGRDMKKILSQSDELSSKIEGILNNELQEKTGRITEYFLSKNYFKDYELIKNIFGQVLKGIKE